MDASQKRDLYIRVAGIAEAAEVEVRFFLDGYAEPGYDGELVAIANWNDRTKWDRESGRSVTIDDRPSRLAKVLKRRYGFGLQWEDEWDECCICYKPVRTKPDCYHWTPSYSLDRDGGYICNSCLDDDIGQRREVVDTAIHEYEHQLSNPNIDLDELGFEEVLGGLEHGLYGGQAADPNAITRSLEAAGYERFVCRLDATGQFDCRFSLWVDRDEVARLGDPTPHLIVNGPDPAVMLDRALRNVPRAEGPGIQHTRVDLSTGTATTRNVDPEEFIDGIRG